MTQARRGWAPLASHGPRRNVLVHPVRQHRRDVVEQVGGFQVAIDQGFYLGYAEAGSRSCQLQDIPFWIYQKVVVIEEHGGSPFNLELWSPR